MAVKHREIMGYLADIKERDRVIGVRVGVTLPRVLNLAVGETLSLDYSSFHKPSRDSLTQVDFFKFAADVARHVEAMQLDVKPKKDYNYELKIDSPEAGYWSARRVR